MPQSLTLPEELLLLAMRDGDGKILDPHASVALGYALAGAVLTELVMRGYVQILPDKTCVAKATDVPDDSLLDKALKLIAKSKKNFDGKHWVMQLYAYTNPVKATLRRLCERGIVREERGKILLVFTTKKYPIADETVKRKILQRLQATLDGAAPAPRTRSLLSLLRSSRLAPLVFGIVAVQQIQQHEEFQRSLEAALQRPSQSAPQSGETGTANFTDEALEEEARRAAQAEGVDVAMDAAFMALDFTDAIDAAIDAVSDAVDSSASDSGGWGGDGGGGDGGSGGGDGGGGDGGSGGGD